MNAEQKAREFIEEQAGIAQSHYERWRYAGGFASQSVAAKTIAAAIRALKGGE